MNDDIDTHVKIYSLMRSKNGVQKCRSPVVSNMMNIERSSTLGYQNKLRLLQHSLMLQLILMTLEIKSLCKLLEKDDEG